jgi:Xaa-Pro aminopeptidase
MTGDTTDPTTDAATGIETEQGCCGTDGNQREPTCGGEPVADEQTGVETDQGCCGSEAGGASEPAGSDETQQRCCGTEAPSLESSGGDDVNDEPGSPLQPNRKSPSEHELIRDAAEQTEALLGELADAWAPDWTEARASEFLHDRIRRAGYDPAWSWDYCPAVHAGADAEVGHTLPGDRTVPAGELLHVDFGLSYEGYASDLQRVYYRGDPDEPIPGDLQEAFEDVRAAIDAGVDSLEPGVRGHEVDAAARSALTGRGWSGFNHAFGHQVGRDAHDGGTLLGPLWDRYGGRPRGEVRAGEVYSVELGVGTTYGYVGLEEMVRVVEDGHEFVVDPQTEIRRLEGGDE